MLAKSSTSGPGAKPRPSRAGASATASSAVVVGLYPAPGGTLIRVVEADAPAGTLRVLRSAGLSADAGDPALARGVVQALSSGGISTRRVFIALPSTGTVVRRVTLPPAAPDQLDGLVLFEAQRHLPLPLDQLATAYVQVPHSAGHAGNGKPVETEVLIAVARKSELSRLEKALAAEGITVTGYGVETLGAADAALAAIGNPDDDQVRLLLVPGPEGVHAFVLRGRALLLQRSLGTGSAGLELRRSLLSLGIERPDVRVTEAWALGPLEGELSTALGMPVRTVEVAQGGERKPGWDALQGLAGQRVGLGTYALQIPAQGWTVQSTGPARSRVLLAALAAAVGIGGAVWWQLDQQQVRARQVEEARRIRRHVENERKQLTALQARRDRLQQQLTALGQGAGPTPLELLNVVSARAPADLWLTQVSYQKPRKVEGSAQPVPTVQIEGTVKDPAHVTDFIRTLERRGGFQRVDLGKASSATLDQVPVTQFRLDCFLPAPKTERGPGGEQGASGRPAVGKGEVLQ